MDRRELLKKIRKIEIKTRNISGHLFSGEYHSAFKGKGMSFDKVREYEPGDDVRSIDWNVTARLNHPYVKVFEEERELTVMLLVDISASSDFGTRSMLKSDLILEMSAVLTFSAMSNNDKMGVLFYSDRVEKFIPPQKGRMHALRIIREMLEFKPEHKGTNLGAALSYMGRVIPKRCTAFLISDFIDDTLEKPLKIYGKKHELIGVQIFDIREEHLPNLGLIHFKDTESGEVMLVDSASAAVRSHYEGNYKRKNEMLTKLFKGAGVDLVRIRTDQSYIQPLLALLRKREGRPAHAS